MAAVESRIQNDPFEEYDDVEGLRLNTGYGFFIDASEPMVTGDTREVFEHCMRPLPELDQFVSDSGDHRLDPARQREQMVAWYNAGPKPVLSAQIWEAKGRQGEMRFTAALFTRAAYATERKVFGLISVPAFPVRHPASAMLVMRDRYAVDRRFVPEDAPKDAVLPRRSAIVTANPANPVAARVTINHAPGLPDYRIRALGDDNFSIERPELPKGVPDRRPAFMVRARMLPGEYQEPGLRETAVAKRARQIRNMARTVIEALVELD